MKKKYSKCIFSILHPLSEKYLFFIHRRHPQKLLSLNGFYFGLHLRICHETLIIYMLIGYHKT